MYAIHIYLCRVEIRTPVSLEDTAQDIHDFRAQKVTVCLQLVDPHPMVHKARLVARQRHFGITLKCGWGVRSEEGLQKHARVSTHKPNKKDSYWQYQGVDFQNLIHHQVGRGGGGGDLGKIAGTGEVIAIQ
jgi:hypothetical protein